MRPLRVGFTGSAEELRRHSRRDLLINLFLGGLYTSVARRHRAEYLASRTTIDGTALAHVPPTRSRWPAILLAVAFIAVRVANEFDYGPPLPLLVICGVLLLPYLWGTVAARTMGAIRWRDLRLSFRARWSEIYLASWPIFVLGLAWIAIEPTVAAVAATGNADLHVAAGAVVGALIAFPLVAAVSFQYRRLRFTRTRVGDLELAWSAGFGAWLRLWCVTAAALLVTAIAPVVLVRRAFFGQMVPQGELGGVALVVYGVSLALIFLLAHPARAWYEARSFALTWNGLRLADRARVTCTLDARAYARMRTADSWRTLRTFGRHGAQAVVNAYEAKLASLQVAGDFDAADQAAAAAAGLRPPR